MVSHRRTQHAKSGGKISTLAFAVTAVLAVLSNGCGTGLNGDESPDPIALDYPIAYVKSPLPTDDDGGNLGQDDARELLDFTAGGDLYLRERASSGADEINITGGHTGGAGDVRDVDISYDGTKLLFSMRDPEIPNADPEDQPKWNIWEYDIPTGTLRSVMNNTIIEELGQDIAPRYLPDGRIVFSSTRQEQSGSILIREGKGIFSALEEDQQDEHAYVLHVMNADGSGIKQISYNQSHDLDPIVLNDGRIAFVRWDAYTAQDGMHLYTVRPDGTELGLLYGRHSHDTGSDGSTAQFLKPRQMPNGDLVALQRAYDDTFSGGKLIRIDTDNYIDNDQPTWTNMGALAGPAQTNVVAFNYEVRTDDEISRGGRFNSYFPLDDGSNRILVSWSSCRLQDGAQVVACTDENLADPNATEAPPAYGLWMYNVSEGTMQPVVLAETGRMITDVVVAQPRELPVILHDKTVGAELDQELADDDAAVLHIRSVYDFGDETFGGCLFTNPNDCVPTGITTLADLADPAQVTGDERPARFLRIVKAVSIPDDTVLEFDQDAFGVNRSNGMREIIGYAPIDPDGSVKVKVPANVALTLSIVDAEGKRIGPRHRNWIQMRPGETRDCVGCHTHTTTGGLTPLPHGRPDAEAPSINIGAQSSSPAFPNTDNTLYSDTYGQTMAEVRTIAPVISGFDPKSFSLDPNVDLFYEDVWTDETASGRLKDTPINVAYSDLATPAPADSSCTPDWSSLCRIVINYEDHIQPIWNRDRGADTCVSCHNTRDAMDALKVPDGQLNLTEGSNDDPNNNVGDTRFKSYLELLTTDLELELDVDTGILVDREEVVLDGGGNPVCQTDPVTGDPILIDPNDPSLGCVELTQNFPVGPTMSTNGARASAAFFAKVDGSDGGHAHVLDPAELKLIAEWLDIGAQYYNNPFDAPPP